MKQFMSVVIVGICLFVSGPIFAVDLDRDRGITATGTCLKKITQDRAMVTFTTNVLAPNASNASKEATKDSQKLRAALQALKLENSSLETTGFNVSEDRQYENKKLVSKGFRARIGLSIETSEIGRVGEAISAAASLGVKEVDSLRTFVSAEKHKAEYEGCLEIATRNARDKAQKLAKGAGIKLGKVLRINEGTVHAPVSSEKSYMRGAPMAMAGAQDAESPTIDARADDMTVSATVTFDAD